MQCTDWISAIPVFTKGVFIKGAPFRKKPLETTEGMLGPVVESVEHGSRLREIVVSNHGRVKPMTYQIDTCRFLARCLALLG